MDKKMELEYTTGIKSNIIQENGRIIKLMGKGDTWQRISITRGILLMEKKKEMELSLIYWSIGLIKEILSTIKCMGKEFLPGLIRRGLKGSFRKMKGKQR